MKIVLTGANGLIGSRIKELLKGYDIVGYSAQDFDITDIDKVNYFLSNQKPDIVIHLAAYTNTEKAEVEKDLCWQVNVTGTENLAKVTSGLKSCRLIYFSTDHTFSGKKGNYVEEDFQEPVNYYGLTKLEGEKVVAKLPGSLILRISYPFRAEFKEKTDVVRWMIPKFEKNETVQLVSDQHISPTFIDDLVNVVDKSLQYQLTGVYHAGGGSCLTFLDIGKVVAKEFGFDENLIRPITLKDFLLQSNRTAKQPQNGCLNSSLIEKDLGVKLLPFEDALKVVKMQLER